MHDRVGVIDVGTNSILALGITHSGDILYNDYKVSEFGQGMKAYNGHLLPERIDAAFDIISTFVQDLRDLKIDDIIIVGTSASRDAKNIDVLINRIKAELSLDYQIISGDDEAYFTYLGALSLYDDPSDQSFVMMDIGGGSTEVIYGQGHDITFKESFQLGVVRLKEMDFQYSLTNENIEAIHDHIKPMFTTLPNVDENALFLGIGGSFTTVGSMYLKLMKYNPSLINGLTLEKKQCLELFHHVNQCNPEQRESLKGLEKKRASLITYGFRIFLEFMNLKNVNALILTDFGLRYGVAKNYFKNT